MLGPDDSVECVPFAAKIPAKTCAARHLAREPSGAGKDWPIFETCARCAVGAARADELVRLGHRIPSFRRFDIAREQVQRFARERLRRSGALAKVPTLDTPPNEE